MNKNTCPSYFLLTLLLLYLLSPLPCFAHAHIFIDYSLAAEFEEGGLKGMRVAWSFDRMYSSFIIQQFDKDKDRNLSQEEVAGIRNSAFHDLAKDAFFAHITHGRKKIRVPTPTEFNAKIIGNQDVVQYTFFLPIQVMANEKDQRVSLFFFDPVIYVSFTISRKDISMVLAQDKIDAYITLEKVKYTLRPTVVFKKSS